MGYIFLIVFRIGIKLKGDVPIELPFPVDMDLDGDTDVVVLSYSYYGVKYKYYKNTGTKENPVYEEDMTNPIPAPENVIMMPSFSDIDGDGDVDIFYRDEVYNMVSEYSEMAVSYLENTGSASQPEFTKKTGPDNPLEFVNEKNYGEEFGYLSYVG